MFLNCPCGYTLTNAAGPGCVVHLLLTDRGIERLEDAVDREVAKAGSVNLWPEHFDAAGAIESWVCPKCLRMLLNVGGSADDVIVYQRERTGLPAEAIGRDSRLGDEASILRLAREQAGPSPLERELTAARPPNARPESEQS